jgi:hypothetical protein
VYGYQAAPGLFGFSDGGHVLVFMRDKMDDVLEFEAGGGGF